MKKAQMPLFRTWHSSGEGGRQTVTINGGEMMWGSVQDSQGLPGTALGEEKKEGDGWLNPGGGAQMVLKSRDTLGRKGEGRSRQGKQPFRGPGAWQV